MTYEELKSRIENVGIDCKEKSNAQVKQLGLGLGLISKASDLPKVPEYSAERGEFKGNPTLTLSTGVSRPFSFGKAKAHAIVKLFEEIKAFADDNPMDEK